MSDADLIKMYKLSSAAGILHPAQRGSKKGSQWIYPENLVCVVFTLIKAFTLIKFKNIK